MKTKLLKIINVLTTLICCLLFAACNQDMMPEDDALRTSVNAGTVYMQDFIPDRNAAVGAEVMLTDKRDNQVYRCIKMADGRWWMGENLKYNVTGSVSYNNEAANLETYGRLYKWQEAAGAIPENWDMPSDDEWKALEMALGMTKEDADAITAWRNSGNVGTQLKANGSSGMGLLLSGYQHTNGTFFYLGTYGRYWTSTEASSANALDRDVYSTKAGVYRGSFGKAYRYAVRCILQVKETTQYMQDFTPAGNEAVGTEVMLTDKRDNIVYRCIKMADGRWWMGENLKYDIEGSVFYDNDSTNLETYGRLYNWQEAADAIPENWDMPSDDEWRVLEIALGMTEDDANGDSWRGTDQGTQLKFGGSSKIDLLLGGYWNGSGYYNLGSFGHYWSSTEHSSTYVWTRIVYSRQTGVYRNTGNTSYRFSVRCILQERETTQYMQDFTPAGNEPVGTEVMLTDKRDNIVYRCIKMADERWWMGENLRGRFGTFVEGQPTETYGLLYDWATNKDYVPEGWSLPTNAEWIVLRDSLGGFYVAGGKMKSTTPDWLSPNIGADNSSGWAGLPGGYYNIGRGGYYYKSTNGLWWSAENEGYWYLHHKYANLWGPYTWGSNNRLSVRCIKNL